MTIMILRIGNKYEAIVDAEDFEDVSRFGWRMRCGYVVRRDKAGKTTSLHRHIMNPPEDKVVDHINHNKLDNRRCNLRICTNSQNLMNMRFNRGVSLYKGVSKESKPSSRPWVAQVRLNKKTIRAGNFHSEELAAKMYDIYAELYFGEFALPNFKLSPEEKSELFEFLDRVNCHRSRSSDYYGVVWKPKIKRWVAQVTHKRKNNYLGCFITPEEASIAAKKFKESII